LDSIFAGPARVAQMASDRSRRGRSTIVLVGVVVFLFLGKFRTTLIPLIAVPISIIGASNSPSINRSRASRFSIPPPPARACDSGRR
jgi:hypothetical protein